MSLPQPGSGFTLNYFAFGLDLLLDGMAALTTRRQN